MSKSYNELKTYLDRFFSTPSSLQWICDDEEAFSNEEMSNLIKYGGNDIKQWNKVLRQYYDQRCMSSNSKRRIR